MGLFILQFYYYKVSEYCETVLLLTTIIGIVTSWLAFCPQVIVKTKTNPCWEGCQKQLNQRNWSKKILMWLLKGYGEWQPTYFLILIFKLYPYFSLNTWQH